MIFAELLTLARKLNLYIVNATDTGAGNDKWNSTTEQKYTVPINKRWFVLNGYVNRDASQSLNVYFKDTSNVVIMQTTVEGAATGYCGMFAPSTNALVRVTGGTIKIILDAGEYCHIVCGGPQSTAAKAALIVLEVDV